MNYCCEKILNGFISQCKSINVITDTIVYHRLYPCTRSTHEQKSVIFIDNFMNTIVNKNEPLNDKELEVLLSLIRKIYTFLQKKGNSGQTLDACTKWLADNKGLDISCTRGILLDDNSIVFFHDYSRIVDAYLKSIIKQGGL